MFKFLKDKLKNVVSSLSKKVEEEAVEVDEPPKEPPKKPPAEPPKKDPKKEQEPKERAPTKEKKPEAEKPEPKKPEPPKEVSPIKKPHRVEEPPNNEKPRIAPEPPKEQKKEEPKKGFLSRIFKKKEEPPKEPPKKPPREEKTEPTAEPKAEPKKPEETPPKIEPPAKEEPKVEPPAEKPKEEASQKPEEHKKGFFDAIKQRFTHLELSEKKFEELFWDLELTMLENNVAVEVIEKIKADLRGRIVGVPLRKSEVDKTIIASLRKSIEELFEVPNVQLLERIGEKKPFVILFLGINGAGKTTTIAKVAHLLKGLGYGVVMAAGDTFRAAAIQQLETHADRIGVKLIKHDYGSDAAAVAFDAVAYAKARGLDVVLIDTAGRLHSNVNLMDELRKMVRVAQPDMKIFIGESITGNDCVEQAKQFNDAVGIDGIILSKADVDEKGGAAISVSYVTGKPILYLGVGQEYKDLQEFRSNVVIEGLGLA